jgi:hypothetical protein
MHITCGEDERITKQMLNGSVEGEREEKVDRKTDGWV